MRSKSLSLALIGAMCLVGARPARADGPLALRAENEQRSVDCKGRDVVIEGNRNTYTLLGGCASITLRGEADMVHATIVPGAHISVQGNDVQLSWRLVGSGADPVISVSGRNSQAIRELGASAVPAPAVPQAARPTAPIPPVAPTVAGAPKLLAAKAIPIEITIDHEARDLDCTGREVHISADHGLYALRGGCSAVIVHGNDDLVQAELAPGAKVELTGTNLKLAYVSLGGGEPPKVKTEGEATKAWSIAAWGGLTGALP